MYYKITDKQSDIYQGFRQLLDREKVINIENKRKVVKKAGSDFKSIMGTPAYKHETRVDQFQGFEFKEPEKIDQKAWKQDKEHPNIMVPNKRTKVGREMSDFLSGRSKELQQSHFGEIYNILGLDLPNGRFKLPAAGIGKDGVILIRIEEEVDHEDVIEITLNELRELNK